jgi:replicative DNA helicase
LLPHDIDAERSLLSTIILDNQAFFSVQNKLKESDFYLNKHQIIFKIIKNLVADNKNIDLVNITINIKKKDRDLNLASYLSELLLTAPFSTSIEQLVSYLRDKSKLRALITSSKLIIDKAINTTVDIKPVIKYAQEEISKIAEIEDKKGFFDIKDIVKESIDKLEELQMNNRAIAGLESGFCDLDEITQGFHKSELTILAARPGVGKTALALNITRNIALKEKVPIAFFSLEMSKNQLSMRLISSESNISNTFLRKGSLKKDDWQRINKAAGIIAEMNIHINDSTLLSVMDIAIQSRILKQKYNIGLIIIDYLQLIEGDLKSNGNRQLEISKISRGLKCLAKDLDVPVLALSQLNRLLEQRPDKRPILSDLRDSGAIEADANNVFFLYKNEEQIGDYELIIAKQRNGSLGTVHLKFDAKLVKFTNI